MAKVLSIASWNVEHFKNISVSDASRVQRIANFISGSDVGPLGKDGGRRFWASPFLGLPRPGCPSENGTHRPQRSIK